MKSQKNRKLYDFISQIIISSFMLIISFLFIFNIVDYSRFITLYLTTIILFLISRFVVYSKFGHVQERYPHSIYYLFNLSLILPVSIFTT